MPLYRYNTQNMRGFSENAPFAREYMNWLAQRGLSVETPNVLGYQDWLGMTYTPNQIWAGNTAQRDRTLAEGERIMQGLPPIQNNNPTIDFRQNTGTVATTGGTGGQITIQSPTPDHSNQGAGTGGNTVGTGPRNGGGTGGNTGGSTGGTHWRDIGGGTGRWGQNPTNTGRTWGGITGAQPWTPPPRFMATPPSRNVGVPDRGGLPMPGGPQQGGPNPLASWGFTQGRQGELLPVMLRGGLSPFQMAPSTAQMTPLALRESVSTLGNVPGFNPNLTPRPPFQQVPYNPTNPNQGGGNTGGNTGGTGSGTGANLGPDPIRDGNTGGWGSHNWRNNYQTFRPFGLPPNPEDSAKAAGQQMLTMAQPSFYSLPTAKMGGVLGKMK